MKHPVIWPRAIILMDMNAFFASIEQMDRPKWRGKPVGVTNGRQGTCIITCSYEARAFGIKTGMRLREARLLCPDLIQCPSRPERYAEVSTAIMESLSIITPDIEVFSVDEAFMDVTHCQSLHGTPEHMARMVKQTVYDASHLPCSVGVSGDKTTAKYAAKLHKPDGLTIIPPWEAKQRLANVPVTELCGINKGIGGFLARYGVTVCGDMEKLPIGVLAKRFGNTGRRIWYMCQGADPDQVHVSVNAPKSIGHGKVMPPATTDREVILTYMKHMSDKVALRLRRHQLQAKKFFIGLRTHDDWIAGKFALAVPTDDVHGIMSLCHILINDYWHDDPVFQLQVTALSPSPANIQFEMFGETDPKQKRLHSALDQVNERYGEFTLASARLLNKSEMPNVIAPAWKPFGHRKTI